MSEELNNVSSEPVFGEQDGLLVPAVIEGESGEGSNPEVADASATQPENLEDTQTPPEANQDINETVQLNKDEYNKLKEYELIEAERVALQERLGLTNVRPDEVNFITADQKVVNVAQQELLRLCNEYGVNADLHEFEKSLHELKQTNPQKGFELERRVETLMHDVGSKRQQIAVQASQQQVQRFAQENQPILQASPVINNILTEYAYYNQGDPDIYNNLNMINNYLMAVCREAFEAGTKYQANEKAKQDTSRVQGGVVNAPQSGYAGGEHIFTRAELKTMSQEEFAKNEKKIQEQMYKGLIV